MGIDNIFNPQQKLIIFILLMYIGSSLGFAVKCFGLIYIKDLFNIGMGWISLPTQSAVPRAIADEAVRGLKSNTYR